MSPKLSRKCALGTLLTPVACLFGQPVDAQLLQDAPTVVVPNEPPLTTQRSVFARDSMIPVAERMLPALSAQGIKLGNFDLFPGLSIGGLYTSNVFANNDRKRSDFAVVVRPEATLRTSGGPYNLDIYARGDFRRYAQYVSEDTEEGMGGIEGSVAIGPLSTLTAGANYGSFIDPRFASDSPVDAAKPLEYRALNGFVGATIEGSTTRVIFRGDVARLRFSDTPRIGGGTIDAEDRDRTRYAGLVRVERSFGPGLSFYVAGSANKIDYRFLSGGVLQRDSSGFGAYVGSSFDVTRLIRGDVRVGYIRQKFNLPGVRAISGIGALGNVSYFPNGLWTFTARGESSVQDSGVPGTAGYLHRGGSISADHELRRYLIASLEGGYYQDTYRGLDRRDKLPFADVSATYLSHNHWNARLGYRYIARHCGDCSGGIARYDDHRVSATLTFQY
ncbi:MAG: hypothetical protein JWO15_2115 [Sphingomonadales bacterium]|nr:hypothetical protein [Sphingomonadales bacterium]